MNKDKTVKEEVGSNVFVSATNTLNAQNYTNTPSPREVEFIFHNIYISLIPKTSWVNIWNPSFGFFYVFLKVCVLLAAKEHCYAKIAKLESVFTQMHTECF